MCGGGNGWDSLPQFQETGRKLFTCKTACLLRKTRVIDSMNTLGAGCAAACLVRCVDALHVSARQRVTAPLARYHEKQCQTTEDLALICVEFF
jgi:hypothetical protein